MLVKHQFSLYPHHLHPPLTGGLSSFDIDYIDLTRFTRVVEGTGCKVSWLASLSDTMHPSIVLCHSRWVLSDDQILRLAGGSFISCCWPTQQQPTLWGLCMLGEVHVASGGWFSSLSPWRKVDDTRVLACEEPVHIMWKSASTVSISEIVQFDPRFFFSFCSDTRIWRTMSVPQTDACPYPHRCVLMSHIPARAPNM